jgi:integrase
MPQKRKPPRLWLRREAGADGVVRRTWIIKDGKRHQRTGCLEDQIADAERQLEAYLAQKYEPQRGGRASQIPIGDVLAVYLDDKAAGTAAPRTTHQIIGRLNEFFGAMAVSDIKGKACRDYAAMRGTQSGGRRDLEVLRAALRHYHKEHGLDVLPSVTLPGKSMPREVYLTRPEAAALLWAALGWERQGTRWTRRRDQKRAHLARLILIGLYTGTRPGAILALQWMRNTDGGWIDLDRGVIFRRAEGERVAHNKRKPPVKIARKLMNHLRRWKRMDGWTDGSAGIRPAVHYLGAPITKPNKAFRSAIAAARLPREVTPHVLRHTRGTWLAQAGVPSGEAAASLGLTVDEYERTYLHNDPSFQRAAADAY